MTGAILNAVNQSNTTFQGLMGYQEIQESSICVIGSGGIGSYLALPLSRLNPRKITVMDYDFYELRNLGGQFVDYDSIDKAKDRVFADKCFNYGAYTKVCRAGRFENSTNKYLLDSNIFVLALDSIEVRKQFYDYFNHNILVEMLAEAIVTRRNSNRLIIDPRMNAELFIMFNNVFTVRINDLIKGGINNVEENCVYLNEIEAAHKQASYHGNNYSRAIRRLREAIKHFTEKYELKMDDEREYESILHYYQNEFKDMFKDAFFDNDSEGVITEENRNCSLSQTSFVPMVLAGRITQAILDFSYYSIADEFQTDTIGELGETDYAPWSYRFIYSKINFCELYMSRNSTNPLRTFTREEFNSSNIF